MQSLWQMSANMPRFSSPRGDLDTDVLIIGGGMAGVLCAQRLHQAGVDYVLAEAGEIGSGVTGCTTAKITAQHGLIYDTLIRRFGEEKARMYLESEPEVMKAIEEKIKDKYREMDPEEGIPEEDGDEDFDLRAFDGDEE